MVSSSCADSGTFLTDVNKFTEATATWRPLWLDGVGAVKGLGPSARRDMLFLSAASKLWVIGGTGGMMGTPAVMPLKFLAATSKLGGLGGGGQE